MSRILKSFSFLSACAIDVNAIALRGSCCLPSQSRTLLAGPWAVDGPAQPFALGANMGLHVKAAVYEVLKVVWRRGEAQQRAEIHVNRQIYWVLKVFRCGNGCENKKKYMQICDLLAICMYFGLKRVCRSVLTTSTTSICKLLLRLLRKTALR